MVCQHCLTIYDETKRREECPHGEIIEGRTPPSVEPITDLMLVTLQQLEYCFHLNHGDIKLES